jgi:hypothetical protein
MAREIEWHPYPPRRCSPSRNLDESIEFSSAIQGRVRVGSGSFASTFFEFLERGGGINPNPAAEIGGFLKNKSIADPGKTHA